MKFSRILVAAAVCLISVKTATAQQPSIGCMDKNTRLVAEEVKQHYLKQGFQVYRDAMVGMSSRTPYPVVAQLQKGSLYRILFVGATEASSIRIETYDPAQKKIAEKEISPKKDEPRSIDFAFTAPQNDSYLFILQQRWKTKDMCGSFTILRLPDSADHSQIKPYTN